jgi:hypothetical protein
MAKHFCDALVNDLARNAMIAFRVPMVYEWWFF